MSPWAPPRPCPGCQVALIPRGRRHCERCETTYNRRRMADPLHAFYTQAPWRMTRAAYLATHPICEEPGCVAPSTRVDHQTPIREGGALFDWQNLRAYCAQHDSAKSSRRGERWGGR